MQLFFDIETIPGQRAGLRDELRAALKPPGNIKKPESIAKWFQEEGEAALEDAYAATALDGAQGQIICIGWAINDAQADAMVGRPQPTAEADIIQSFFRAVQLARISPQESVTIVGHNVINFDLRFLWQRCYVHGIRPPAWLPRDPKPWGGEVFDTMTAWAGSSGRVSLDKLARALGLGGKSGSGADVWPMVQAGEWDRLAEYCAQDVELARECWRKLTFAHQGLPQLSEAVDKSTLL